MRHLRILLFLVLSVYSLTGLAQSTGGKITGTVTTENQKALESATISLLHAGDSSVAKINVSDKAGKFEFENIPDGKYLVMISAVGYESSYSPAEVSASSTNTKLKTVQLLPQAQSMAGVVVTAKKAPIEIRAGKTVVNVDASPTNAGLNVLEILEKSPGVAVDNDDNVSLKGKNGVLILIDGKQTYLAGAQLAAFLKSIQASSLDQIEIMTNPPAKYDASGNAGVINIKTKKGTLRGMNGNVSLTYNQGYYPKYFAGANFNYRSEKVNIFGSYDGGQWEGLGVLSIDRRFYKNSVLSGTSDQKTTRHNKANWNNLKLGFDYNFSKKDVAGIVVTGRLNPWKNWQTSTSNLRDVDGEVNTLLLSDAYNANKSNSISTNFNYKHSFDSTGREITLDLDYGYYTSRGNNFLTTRIYDPSEEQRGNTILLDGHLPSNINIYTAKTDYVHPFSKNTKLEAGLKTSFVNTDNNVRYQRDTTTGWKIDDQRTNHFVYKENVNAAYAILTHSVKKWEFTGGLRVENTNASGTQKLNDSSFNRNYTSLFPNAGAAYTINDKNQLSFAYSRRIRRPDYEDLNPFIFFLDSLTYGQGNPYLQPEFSNRIELSHTFKKFITTTVSFTQTDDIITDILKQYTEKKTTFQTKENFARMQQYGLSVSLNKQLTSWWSLNVYAGVFNNRYNGIYNDGASNTPVEIDVTGFNGNLSHSFTFAQTWAAELSGWFNSNPSEGLLIARSMGAMNAGISKQLFKKKATIKFGVRDILRTSNFKAYSRYADVDLDVFNDRRLDNRIYNVSFTYKFGKNNIAPERRRSGGSNEEQSRVKSGG
ncbi:MAG: TonB-dependent receptor [Chitinophagaceae bacterium]|nr:TonB-dependent receptor [Chitinophagaceae bacterium]